MSIASIKVSVQGLVEPKSKDLRLSTMGSQTWLGELRRLANIDFEKQ
jgi:hypothetical protein